MAAVPNVFHKIARALLLVLVPMAIGATPASAERGSWKPIPDTIWQDMQGKSWHPGFGCPARDTLALLSVPYMDFSGQTQAGELIVARSQAKAILDAFAQILRAGFAIERMQLVHHYGGSDDRSMASNNTSAFNCRRVTSGKRLSEHSWGKAIDINPVQNPYVSRSRTLPPSGKPYDTNAERQADTPGLIKAGGPVVKAFVRIGWKWGGTWRRSKDYQHFSKSGR